MSRKTRKLMWSVPLIAAVAVIGALAAFMTLTPNDASAQEVTSGTEIPGMVRDLEVVPHTDGIEQEELVITWEAPDGGGYVTSYRIDVSEDGQRWLSYITDHGNNDLRVVHSGLSAGDMRHFRVFAWNEHGTGPGTSASGRTAASWRPDRPEDLDAMDGAPDIPVDLNGDGDAADMDVDNVDETMFLFDVNGSGGAWQTDVDGQDETATSGRDGTAQTVIKLEWEPSEDPPGAPVTVYRIEYSGNGERWHLLTNSAAVNRDADGDQMDPQTYWDVGLRAETKRWYRVYAINTVGTSDVSDGDTATTAASTPPESLDGTVVIGLSPAATDVHLTWTQPTDPAGDPITHYRVQARTAVAPGETDNDWGRVPSGGIINRNTNCEGAKCLYNFGGRDLGNAGITVPANIPVDEDMVDGDGTELVEVDIRIAAINRANDGDLDDDTTVDPIITSGVEWATLSDVPVGHENAPLRASTPNADADTDQHQGRSGIDVTWDEAKFNTNKGPDKDETGTTGFDQAVSYILVIDDVEEDMTSEATPQAMEHGNALPLGGNTNKPGYDDDGLPAETEKEYYLYALNSGVSPVPAENDDNNDAITVSVRSFPSAATTGTTARPKQAGAPENLVATGSGHTEIKLTWGAPMTADTDNTCDTDGLDGTMTPPTENDGSECGASVIDGYKIDISDTGTSGWTTLEEMETSPYTADTLMPDQRYHFRVSAVNSRGAGTPSATKSADTTDPGEPTPPGGLVAQSDGHDTLKICWYEQNIVEELTGDAALDEGLPLLGYKITYVDGENEVVLEENTMSMDTQYMDPNTLAGETTRTYRVRSITLGGVGEMYAEAMATTAEGPPSTALTAPTMVEAMGGTGELTVTWVDGENAVGHLVLLLDGAEIEAMETAPTGNSHMFTGLSAGVYTAVVVSYKSTSDYDYNYDADSVQ